MRVVVTSAGWRRSHLGPVHRTIKSVSSPGDSGTGGGLVPTSACQLNWSVLVHLLVFQTGLNGQTDPGWAELEL